MLKARNIVVESVTSYYPVVLRFQKDGKRREVQLIKILYIGYYLYIVFVCILASTWYAYAYHVLASMHIKIYIIAITTTRVCILEYYH